MLTIAETQQIREGWRFVNDTEDKYLNCVLRQRTDYCYRMSLYDGTKDGQELDVFSPDMALVYMLIDIVNNSNNSEEDDAIVDEFIGKFVRGRHGKT